jgi:nucleotide-binding universal stress UspA family protein
LSEQAVTSAAEKARLMMFQWILVPLDGSELAEEALPAAEAIADRFNASLIVLQVGPLLSSASVASSPRMDPTWTHRMERQAVDAYLTRIAAQARTPGRAVTPILREGDPADQILAYAREERVDLIAMTARGQSGRRSGLGSVAAEVMKKAPCPVLIEPTGGQTGK